jgi:hypothetical protein
LYLKEDLEKNSKENTSLFSLPPENGILYRVLYYRGQAGGRMAVPDLAALGAFLVGEDPPAGWLQALHASASPHGDFVALGLEQRLVLLAARYSGGRRRLVPVYEGALHGCGEESLTCLLVLPVLSGRGARSCWHATLAGFSSGHLRVYTEAGQLLVQKAFHDSAVRRLGVQAMPEGKHFSQVLHLQALQELLVVHPTLVVTVSAADLFSRLTTNLTCLARATAEDGEVEAGQLAELPGLRLLVREQRVEDCASLVTQHTAYSQYLGLTMQGGVVDARHRPVHTAPAFITAGLGPFLSFNDRHSEQGGPAALAHTVVSTVKSGLFRVATGAIGGLWGAATEPGPRPDPEAVLGVRLALRDEGRQGLEVLLSPNKVYSAVRDAQNRVMVVENISGTVVQAWRGYHRVQMAWGVTSRPRGDQEEVTTEQQLAVLLLLYLPRRGLIEVWSPEQKMKVTEFHVSQHGLLLRSCLAALDDGIPRRRESIALHAAFLPPSGLLHHFHVPFHALSTSSTAERDLQVQAELQELARAGPVEAETLAALLLEVRNPQLRRQVLADLLVGEHQAPQAIVPALLAIIWKSFEPTEDNVSRENKLWRSKVNKLYNLSIFFEELAREDTEGPEEEGARAPEEALSHCLATDLEEVAVLLEVAPLGPALEETPMLCLPDFLSCFETEGDLASWRATDAPCTRLRRHLAPPLGLALHRAVARLACRHAPALQDHFLRCGLCPGEFLRLATAASLQAMDHTLPGTRRLYTTMAFLLNLNANVDDRHRATCQEVVLKGLRHSPMSPSVYVLGTVWRCALAAQGNLSLGVWAEEWARRLRLVRAFLRLRAVVAEVRGEGEDSEAGHSISTVFECGNGRVSELVARWLHGLGCDVQSLARSLEETLQPGGPAQRVVAAAAESFPRSSSSSVLLVHLAWEQLQAWSRDRNRTELLLPSLLPGLWAVPCPALRARAIRLVWQTFFSKLLQEAARLAGSQGAGTAGGRAARCQDALQMRPDSVAAALGLMAGLLDCQLQSLTLAGAAPLEAAYDVLGPESHRPHLLDHVLAGPEPDVEAVSLQHQLATVLELSWTLGVPVRPLQVFSTAEAAQLLQTQPGVFSSLFTDHNVAVGRARAAWVAAVVEAAAGRVHLRLVATGIMVSPRVTPSGRAGEGRLPDTEEFQAASGRLQQLARLWFLTDHVRSCQVPRRD